MSLADEGRIPRTREVIWIFLKRDLKLWTYFKLNFAIELAGVFSNLLIYSVIASFRPGGEFLAAYGGDYVTFVIVGLAVNELLMTSLSAPYYGVMNSFWSNRLELLMMSPISLQVFVVGTSLGGYVRSFFRILIYVVFGSLMFGLRFPAANYGLASLFLALGILASTGLGLMAASMIYLVDARGGQDPIRWIVGILSGLVSGVYFPLQALPESVRWIGCFIPNSYVLDGARRALSMRTAQATLPIQQVLPFDPLVTNAVLLIFYLSSVLPLGWYMFRKGISEAKKDGRLSRWV